MEFFRQKRWNGLPFPSPMHESEKWKWSCVWLFATPWTAAYQAPPPMGLSRQDYWSGVQSPSPMQVAKTVLKTLAIPGSFRSFRHQFTSSDSFSNYSVIMPFHPLSLWNITSYFKARILSDYPDVENKLRNRFSHYSIPLVTVKWLTVMHYFYPYIIGFFPFKTTYWTAIFQVLYSFLGL